MLSSPEFAEERNEIKNGQTQKRAEAKASALFCVCDWNRKPYASIASLKNLLCTAVTALSASERSIKTEILISLVAII